MKKLWNDWSGPVAFTLGWTLLLAAALLMPNVPVWADGGIGQPTRQCSMYYCDAGCMYCTATPQTNSCAHPQQGQPCPCNTAPSPCVECACQVSWSQDYQAWICRCK